MYCTVCDCSLTSSKDYANHEQGKRHKKKLKQQPAVANTAAATAQVAASVELWSYHCGVCDVQVPTKERAVHEQGRKHTKKQPAVANTSQVAATPVVSLHSYRCGVCDVKVPTTERSVHEQGKAHKTKLQVRVVASGSPRSAVRRTQSLEQWAAAQAEDSAGSMRRAGAVNYMQGVCSAFCYEKNLGRCVLVPTGSSMLGVHTADSDIDAVLVVSGKFRVADPFDKVSGPTHLRALFGAFQREVQGSRRVTDVHCVDDHVRVPIIAMKVDGFEVDLSICRLLEDVPASLSRSNLSLFSPASPNAAALPSLVDPLTQLQMNGIRDGLYLQQRLTPAGRLVLRYIKAWAKATGMCKVGFPSGVTWALLVAHFSPTNVDSFFRSLKVLLESPRTVHADAHSLVPEARRSYSAIVNWSESERLPTEIFPVLSPNFPVVNTFLGANRHSVASLRVTVDKTLVACGGSEQAYMAHLGEKHSTAFLNDHARFVFVHLDAGKDTASFVGPKLRHVWAPHRKFPGESRKTPDLQLRGWDWCDPNGHSGRQQAVNYVFGIPTTLRLTE